MWYLQVQTIIGTTVTALRLPQCHHALTVVVLLILVY